MSIVQHQKCHPWIILLSDKLSYTVLDAVSDVWLEIYLVHDQLVIFSADGTVVNPSIPRALSKPVYLHDVVCSSSDLNLLGCSFSKYSGHVNDVQHAIITCQQCKDYMHYHLHTHTSSYIAYISCIASCKDGDLKLVGANSENEGRLEVCFDQRWGTINGDGWTHTDTQVACRQLGYSTSGRKKGALYS